MPRTKGWYIVSELNGYTLNLTIGGDLQLNPKAKNVWMKHNWLHQTIVCEDSEYDEEYTVKKKQEQGHLIHIGTGYALISCTMLFNRSFVKLLKIHRMKK